MLQFTNEAVGPEPAVLALLGIGLAALAAKRRPAPTRVSNDPTQPRDEQP